MKINNLKFGLLALLGFLLLANFPISPLSQLRKPHTVLAQDYRYKVYLPAISRYVASRAINVPYFTGTPDITQMGIFWFGQVTPAENYADVRVGYNASELTVRVNVIDRQIWFNAGSSASVLDTLTQYDAITLYLDPAGGNPRQAARTAHRFEVQMNELWTHLPYHKRASTGTGQGWQAASTAVTDEPVWRGDGGNDGSEGRGWLITFHIPFSSLGLSGAPQQGQSWGLALDLHDRDSQAGPANLVKAWPYANELGKLTFGMPTYTPPQVSSLSSPVTVRHGVNGVVVKDAMVGGGFESGSGTNYWTTWGSANYYGMDKFNIQNQYNVDDFPCFSKEYLVFPLPQVPAGKVFVSARLTLHHFGNSDPANASDSYIQVMRVAEDWNTGTISWNTAPLALENYAAAWVQPIRSSVPWPGNPYTFDISRAVADAYAEKVPLRLALYSADFEMHSGKYFVSSYVEDWNTAGRPVIEIVYGTP